ncbi:3-phosphoserine/phosphohydroxythreonine transaminase [Leeia sp. TBRC 13508]|uniref:Phosphoserine aminotransferase n=1 Tax=Leeia speluncae TaxID=2884804 RepID=A0ABS8DC66_9NEIS|nr:3-phosphoserine/phosphohydroxythreonine transaminase [Leeia speluncae]MCB6185238.1 3-phosphoserine/phosphohydroxythreonine transaminase [Leeia speluncae]
MTIFNFSAGPAVLPRPVLEQAQAELIDWHGSGMSVMEMSHRGPEFQSIIDEALADLRELMNIPSNYQILFLQGGAQGQFSAVPLNLIGATGKADYVNTGHWSTLAMKEAARFGQVNEVCSSADSRFDHIPAFSEWKLSKDASYVHYTPNETVGGLEFQWVPEVGDVPLVADMSSNILSREIDVSKFGLIYAGAQKNIGPSGLTLVIVRDDLIGKSLPITPVTYDYKKYADAGSMYNTPSTYGIYLAGLVFKWLKAQGGVAAMEAINVEKSNLLYHYLNDCGGFYYSPIAEADRSRMNVVFRLKDEALDAAFLKESKAAGLLQLKGHKIAGGMRASIYNAMPVEGVQALLSFMKDFAQRNG